MCLTRDGHIWCWGMNKFHQLGSGSREYREKKPQLVQALIGKSICFIAAGFQHSAAISGLPSYHFPLLLIMGFCLEEGELFLWGDNSFKQCGFVEGASIPIPCQCAELQGYFVKQVGMGFYHTLILASRGYS